MKKLNQMQLKFLSLSENESFARACVAAFCVSINPTVDELTDIKTAVSEAVTNCVVHAYPKNPGEITLSVTLYENAINIVISDNGIGIKDIKQAREPFFTTKPEQERSGMGFTVMESFMDELEVTKTPLCNGICINMTKYINTEQVKQSI